MLLFLIKHQQPDTAKFIFMSKIHLNQILTNRREEIGIEQLKNLEGIIHKQLMFMKI